MLQKQSPTPIFTPHENPYEPLSWIELRKTALIHNAAMYKKTTDGKNIAFVIKGNAYGHGIREIALLCEDIDDIDWLCTFTLSEALMLRSLGSSKPILVLGPLDAPIAHALGASIDVIVDNHEQAEQLNICARQENKKVGVHVKVDTGLSRRGVLPDQAMKLLMHVSSLSHLTLNGLCTHLVESYKEDASFTHHQLKQFNALIYQAREYGMAIPFIHATNTAGTTIFSHDEYNFFRIGIGLYGILPSQPTREKTRLRYPDFELEPVLQWKTVLTQIKDIPAHAYVSYDRTYQTYRPTRIGLLPIGYSDGYDIRLSNKGLVYIRGAYAPVLGRVGMNTTIIDLTTISQAQEKDEVTLIGSPFEIRADIVSSYAQCINVRELFTGIKGYIPRIVI
ncbi:MAG TPA: alanine racemase [Candidatus Bathyarchaeia archaeon]|nr:alanine racemase [Candidatus Bathyarchaeia archaeon]